MKLAEAVRAATESSRELRDCRHFGAGTRDDGRGALRVSVGRGQNRQGVFPHASDVMAILAHTRDVIYLEEGDVTQS